MSDNIEINSATLAVITTDKNMNTIGDVLFFMLIMMMNYKNAQCYLQSA